MLHSNYEASQITYKISFLIGNVWRSIKNYKTHKAARKCDPSLREEPVIRPKLRESQDIVIIRQGALNNNNRYIKQSNGKNKQEQMGNFSREMEI